VLEVGAGIGTFSERILAGGAERMLLLEPDPACAGELERRFGGDSRVSISREGLPDSAALAEATEGFDLAVCQNVLEHIGDDEAAMRSMAAGLRPGGHLALIVPASPRLYGALDDAYGHWRRYTEGEVAALARAAGLEIVSLRRLNALGVPGWWAKNLRPGARIGPASLAAYEAMVGVWRPIEDRLRPSVGLSLACLARKPEG
jgi:SAM-dependent methyltransferase